MARPIVVLPDPDSPTSPTTSPVPTVKRDAVDGAERRRPAALRVLDGDVAQVDDEVAGVGAGCRRCARAPRHRRSARPRSRRTRPRRGAAPPRSSSLRVRVAAARGRPASTVPDSTIRPRCITSTRSDEVGDDAHVVGDQQDAGVDAVAQVAHQLEDLGLHGDVERGRRLVGDQQLRVAAPAPGRSSPAAAARPTAGAGRRRRAAPGPGSRPARAARWPAARASLGRHRLVAAQHLGDLEPDRVHRVERGHRLLEDHRDLPAADRSQRALVDADELLVAELDRAARRARSSAAGPSSTSRSSTCPDPDSPTIASTSPALSSNDGVDDRRVPGAVDPEVDVEVADARARASVVGAGRHRSTHVSVRAAALARWRRARGVPAVVRPRC